MRILDLVQVPLGFVDQGLGLPGLPHLGDVEAPQVAPVVEDGYLVRTGREGVEAGPDDLISRWQPGRVDTCSPQRQCGGGPLLGALGLGGHGAVAPLPRQPDLQFGPLGLLAWLVLDLDVNGQQ